MVVVEVHTLENVVPTPTTVGQPPRKDPQMEYSKIVPQSEQTYRTARFSRDNATHADITKPDYIYTKLMTLKLDSLVRIILLLSPQ
ncbi:hypothetical protein Tco_1213287 [Tanacetum coccineum]